MFATRCLAALALLCMSASIPVVAQDYPAQSIKLIVGASAGGTTDTMARALGQQLSTSLNRPVVVENRAGAGGNLAAEFVARSKPDGSTLLVSFTSHSINASLYPKLPFDPVNDFTPISMISKVPSLLVGHPKLPAQNLKDLIALAKQQPGKFTMAVGGIGSSLHLAGDQFKTMAGVDILNVPYKGTAPALQDVVAGQVNMMFISMVTGSAQVQGGALRAFGATSAARQQAFPDLPAIGEVVPGFESEAWFGLFGPANLPADVTAKLSAAVVAALNDPKMVDYLRREGATPAAMTPEAFSAFVRADIQRWAPIVKQSGATPE